MDLDSMKLTHGGIWKQIQVKEKKKNQSSKAPWLVRYRPPWIISKKEDPGHSKNCRKAAKKVFWFGRAVQELTPEGFQSRDTGSEISWECCLGGGFKHFDIFKYI